MKLIICAMNLELEATLNFYQPTKINFIDNIELYQKDDWLFAISKIGQVNASLVLTTIIIKYQITEIYNFGAVGTLKPEFKILDVVYVATARYLFADVSAFGYQMGQIPGENETFNSDAKLLDNFKKRSKLELKSANLGTSDIFIDQEKYLDFIVKSHDNKIDIIDMEGAALFHIANKFTIPMISIKVISDYILSPIKSQVEFQENLNKISNLIKEIIISLIEKTEKNK